VTNVSRSILIQLNVDRTDTCGSNRTSVGTSHAHLSRLVLGQERHVWLVPVAPDAEALELLSLRVHRLARKLGRLSSNRASTRRISIDRAAEEGAEGGGRERGQV
jgi:hypothetical protein